MRPQVVGSRVSAPLWGIITSFIETPPYQGRVIEGIRLGGPFSAAAGAETDVNVGLPAADDEQWDAFGAH